jgi:hypothetical protein
MGRARRHHARAARQAKRIVALAAMIVVLKGRTPPRGVAGG